MSKPAPAARRKRGRDSNPVALEGGALRVDDRVVPLRSGAMHYFRLPKDTWRDGLRALADLGLPMVETYVPWQVHERVDGSFDFGETDPRKNVGEFLDMAAEEGLLAFVRPGPHINAEMTFFGLSERVVFDKACQARSSRQNAVVLFFPPRMFPVPSYASERFHEEVGAWYDAVGEVIGPRIYPKGNVVLLQVDNEAAYYFRDGPYCQDYHPDASALYRDFLRAKHGDLDALRHAHRRRYDDWSAVEPPERFDGAGPEDLPRHLDWAAFREHLMAHAVGRMGARMGAAGMTGVPTVHNVPLGDSGLPVSVPAFEREVDLVGYDYYHAVREHRTIKRRTLFLTGSVQTPYAPELGAGAPPWFTPLGHGDSLYCAMAASAYGLRGYNLYMAVDRDRWYGAPIDSRGAPRDEHAEWKRFHEALDATAFHELRRDADVALVVPKEYRRLSRATHLLGALTPSALEAAGSSPVAGCRDDALGFDEPIQLEWWHALARVSDALTAAGVPYAYVDSEAAHARFEGYRLVYSPTWELCAEKRWAALAHASESGAKVVIGPLAPSIDDDAHERDFQDIPGLERVRLEDAAQAEAWVAQVLESLNLRRPFAATPAPVESEVHGHDDGPRVLFCMNPGPERVPASVVATAGEALEDLLTGDTIAAHDGAFAVTMRPRSARMFRLHDVRRPEPDEKKKPDEKTEKARAAKRPRKSRKKKAPGDAPEAKTPPKKRVSARRKK